MIAVVEPRAETADAVAFYFGPESRQIFGWYHPPAVGQSVSNPAIVLCQPIGYEGQAVRPYYRYVAERLSAAGFPVLRFDYDGTGDSFGSDDDPDRVESWIASIGHAVDALRWISGSERMALFGVRLGATMALIAASRRGDIDTLVLWAVCRTGRSYLRELRLLTAARRGKYATNENAPANPLYEEAAGFYYTAETVARLDALDGTAIEQRPASRALLIGRDDMPSDARIQKRLEMLQTETTTRFWSGYQPMMLDPHESEIPVSTVDSLLDWLRTADYATARDGNTPRALPVPKLPHRLEAAEFSEEPFQSNRRQGVFGILARPKRTLDPSLPVILLITVGGISHVGPSRMYVTMARRMAASGYSVLRFDVDGVGDSASGSESARKFVYSSHSVESVRHIIREIKAVMGASRIILIGLCSGAYAAYRVAIDEPAVVSQILINPQAYEWQDDDSLDKLLRRNDMALSRHYASSIRDPEKLKRILYRQVDLAALLKVLSKRLYERVRTVSRRFVSAEGIRSSFQTEILQQFRRISDRGVRTFFLFADSDFGIEVTALEIGAQARKLRGYKTVRYQELAGADHTFSSKEPRDAMIDLVQEYVEQEVPRAATASSELTV